MRFCCLKGFVSGGGIVVGGFVGILIVFCSQNMYIMSASRTASGRRSSVDPYRGVGSPFVLL